MHSNFAHHFHSLATHLLERHVGLLRCPLSLPGALFLRFALFSLRRSLQCRRFHRERANGFNRESAMLKLPKRGGNGASQGEGGRSGEKEEKTPIFSPLPLPPLLFCFHTYRKGYYFYSPQSSSVIESKMAASS